MGGNLVSAPKFSFIGQTMDRVFLPLGGEKKVDFYDDFTLFSVFFLISLFFTEKNP